MPSRKASMVWCEDDCVTVVDMLGHDGCEASTVGPSIVWMEMKSDRERIEWLQVTLHVSGWRFSR